MPRGFAKNTSTQTRLSFDVDRLLGRSEIMQLGIKKSREKCIYVRLNIVMLPLNGATSLGQPYHDNSYCTEKDIYCLYSYMTPLGTSLGVTNHKR